MLNRKGQSTLEYALVIAIIIAGLLLMQHYIRRGYAGRLRSASDDMGEQFDPHVYTGNFTINQFSNVRQTFNNRVSKTAHISAQQSNRVGTESITAWGENESLYSK